MAYLDAKVSHCVDGVKIGTWWYCGNVCVGGGGGCGGVNLAYISIVHTLACCAAFVFIYMWVFLIPVSCCAISTIDDDNHNKNSQNLS